MRSDPAAQSQTRSWHPLSPPAEGMEEIDGSSASGLAFPVKIASNPIPVAFSAEGNLVPALHRNRETLSPCPPCQRSPALHGRL